MMISRYRDIIFLLGAGASAEAGIPTSGEMIRRIEMLLNENEEWCAYEKLYNHIKSSIHYAAGLNGLFNEAVPYNIETLVNTLYELERNEQHPLYPFIASWNSRLLALAGPDFKKVRDFRGLILDQLKQWMSPDDVSKADYYQGFKRLQEKLNFPLRIFSLNYDLCVERLHCDEFRVETGFGGFGPQFPWDWERFEEGGIGPEPPQVYLYKLHGSINWKRDHDTKQLFRVEQIAGIDAKSMELIFGRDFKLEAADPYLFYLYAFREASLNARLIVLIGYGLGDSHINNMLTQALRDDKERRLLLIENCDEAVLENRRIAVAKTLGVGNDQVVVKIGGAKAFLDTNELGAELQGMIPKSSDAPF